LDAEESLRAKLSTVDVSGRSIPHPVDVVRNANSPTSGQPLLTPSYQPFGASLRQILLNEDRVVPLLVVGSSLWLKSLIAGTMH
jgi:hypothetical protein